ncbi:MAG: PhoH family protein [Flavobacteriales bacterium]|nr:PhoH family protein [Flavobacteriales bacterium]MCX7768370.1 PhoH family protein [Flavobacteriales bacterium]MDW8409070.1 PhoH family protein [Flavobacteriales bacterium]
MTPRKKKDKKIFILDTSVILFNHNAINCFEEHDVAIPISVLEELDNFKKGNDTKNFEARQFIRMMDEYSQGTTFNDWIPLNGSGKGFFRVVMDEHAHPDAREVFGEDKVDHRILNAALALKAQYPTRRVILVSKDINLRIKAKSLLIEAEDFETGKVQDISRLYTGKSELFLPDSRLIEAIYTRGYIEKDELPPGTPTFPNHYYLLTSENSSALAYMNPETNRVERVERKEAYGIRARNVEQVFALHALLNPQVRLVTLQGVAGTGKTLLALAAALETRRQYWQIYLARPIVPLSNKDIGYLPGDIKSKLHPYMEPLYDNLKYIQSRHGENDKEARKINELLENEKLVIQPLAYIRGRSLSNVFFIVDEAQNLTPHEIKTIITRAGEGTKVVFTGDIFQIDTPYLDTESNGLSYLIDKIHHHPLHAHITLEKGERSELANLANELL